MYKYIAENLNIFFIIVIFIWISFFPAPIQGQYDIVVKFFMFFGFLDLWASKGRAIFRLCSLPLWAFIAAISLSCFFTANKATTVSLYLNMALPLVFIYYMAKESFSDEFVLAIFVRVISICSIIIAIVGIVQCVFPEFTLFKYFNDSPYYKHNLFRFIRPVSTQWHPKVLASYLVYSFPFNIALYKRENSFFKWIGMAGIILSVPVTLLTLSRSAFIALITMTIFCLFIQREYILLKAFSACLLIFCFISSVFSYPLNSFSIDYMITSPATSIFSINNFTRHFKVLEIIKKSPLLGIGFGNSNMVIDNTYLRILAETGFIGFLGFLIFILYLVNGAWKKLGRFKAGSKEQWFLLAVFLSFIGLLIDFTGYDVYYWPNPYLYFCILAGCLGVLSRTEQVKNNESSA